MADPNSPVLPEEQTAFDFCEAQVPPVEAPLQIVAPPEKRTKAKPAHKAIKSQTVAPARKPPQTVTAYLSVREVAALFGVSRATIWRWTGQQPDFPTPVKFNATTTRWAREDLRAFECKCAAAAKGTLK